MNLRACMAACFLILFIGCEPIPDGYNKESWEHLKRENPSGAQLVRWIHEDSSRRTLQRTYIEAGKRGGRSEDVSRIRFLAAARIAMLQGVDLRAHLIHTHEQSLLMRKISLYQHEHAQRLLDGGDPPPPFPVYVPPENEVIKTDTVILEALKQ